MTMTCSAEKVMTTTISFYLADIKRQCKKNWGHLGADGTLRSRWDFAAD